MEGTSASTAKLSKDYFNRQLESTANKIDISNLLWLYRNRGLYQGVPVALDALDLFVSNAELLLDALQPSYKVLVWSGYLSPEEEDKKSIQEYQNIIQDSVDSKVTILDKKLTFCTDRNKFMVLITYATMLMQLHPRYSHLKLES